ncbi:MAG: iron complex transport system substrate-binding protein [Bradyrhizobium sp.]|jgi:iron complex transport system substrate-binding protein|nr:iron complex transport system substrate-binding protein [Bradyrhizobium sp.]
MARITSIAGLLSACAVAVMACVVPARTAESPSPRIASMNVCTDQLLLTLADPEQILGLSRYARDRFQSWAADDAGRYRILSGGAEDILVIRPDVVVASLFDKRATRELLKEKGLRVVEFDVPRSLDDVKDQIRRIGEITRHPERAAAEIAKLDAAIARVRQVAARNHVRVLPLSRRGWVSGSESLLSSLLTQAGLANAAAELGVAFGGFAPLETIVSTKPDFLVVSDAGDRAEDDGSAFLLHPALQRFYPSSKRIVIPDRLTVCGGVMLAEALDVLIAELHRVGR